MITYRIYLMDEDLRIHGVSVAECGSDQEACAHAAVMVGTYRLAEVWDGARLVRQVWAEKPPHSPVRA